MLKSLTLSICALALCGSLCELTYGQPKKAPEPPVKCMSLPELARFPAPADVKSIVSEQSEYMAEVEELALAVPNCPAINDMLERTRDSAKAWGLLHTAHFHPELEVRRQHLDKLLDHLGPDDFEAGLMPEPFPSLMPSRP